MITIGIPAAAVWAVFIMVSASSTGELSCYHSYIDSDTTNDADYSPNEMAGLEQCDSCCNAYDRRQQECTESQCQKYSNNNQYRLHLFMILAVKWFLFASNLPSYLCKFLFSFVIICEIIEYFQEVLCCLPLLVCYAVICKASCQSQNISVSKW